jgi:hypothetical protein
LALGLFSQHLLQDLICLSSVRSATRPLQARVLLADLSELTDFGDAEVTINFFFQR